MAEKKEKKTTEQKLAEIDEAIAKAEQKITELKLKKLANLEKEKK